MPSRKLACDAVADSLNTLDARVARAVNTVATKGTASAVAARGTASATASGMSGAVAAACSLVPPWGIAVAFRRDARIDFGT